MLNEKYALLGTYQEGMDRNNVEIIATSNDRDELINIWNAIETVNKKLQFTDREINIEIEELIEKKLEGIEITNSEQYFDYATYVYEIKVIDIIEMKRFRTTYCNKCGKILFVGTKAEAKGLCIYCDDC